MWNEWEKGKRQEGEQWETNGSVMNSECELNDTVGFFYVILEFCVFNGGQWMKKRMKKCLFQVKYQNFWVGGVGVKGGGGDVCLMNKSVLRLSVLSPSSCVLL